MLRLQHDWFLDVGSEGNFSFWAQYETFGQTLPSSAINTKTQKTEDAEMPSKHDFESSPKRWDGEIRKEKGHQNRFEATQGFQVQAPCSHALASPRNRTSKFTTHELTVTAPDNTDTQVRFFSPARVWKYRAMQLSTNAVSPTSSPSPSSSSSVSRFANSISLSPSGELAVTGADSGDLRVWDAETGVMYRHLQGHVGGLNTARFFPSGKVTLSGGADLVLKIFDLESGTCAATLKGHTAPILQTAFIERGRNFISCGKDGTCRLWETSTQSQVSLLQEELSATHINDCMVLAGFNNTNTNNNANTNNLPQRQQDSREYGTLGKVVATVTEGGHFTGLDLTSRTTAFRVASAHPALRSCAPCGTYTLATGSSNGFLSVWDVRKMASGPLVDQQVSTAALPRISRLPPAVVQQMSRRPYGEKGKGQSQEEKKNEVNQNTSDEAEGLLLATEDGACSVVALRQGGWRHVAEFSGPDYEPLFDMAIWQGVDAKHLEICTVARDGNVYKYVLP